MSKVNEVKKETAVAVKKETAISEEMKLEMQQFSEENVLVQVRSDILKISRLKLVQKMSDTLGTLGEFGDFVCEVKGKNYGKTVDIIPVMARESATLMVRDSKVPICKTTNLITNLNGVKCTACPFNSYWNNWGTKDEPIVPACKTSIDVICLVGEEREKMEISFRKTSYAAGKQLINFMINDRLPIPFASIYTLKSKDQTSKGHDYKLIDTQIERKELTNEEISKIIPIVKHLVQLEKQGSLIRVEEEIEVETNVVLNDDLPV